MGNVYGLDFSAVMTVGAALGCDVSLLADVLPDVERAIVLGFSEGGESDGTT